MFIRTANERDLPGVSRLIAEAAHATFDSFHDASVVEKLVAERFSVSRLTSLLERQRSEFLVADDGSALGGVAFGAAEGDDARIVSLDILTVRPDQQGRGIGGLLLEEFEQSFFESELVQLDVDEQDARALRFYLDAGFAEIGRKTGPIASSTLLTLQKSLV